MSRIIKSWFHVKSKRQKKLFFPNCVLSSKKLVFECKNWFHQKKNAKFQVAFLAKLQESHILQKFRQNVSIPSQNFLALFSLLHDFSKPRGSTDWIFFCVTCVLQKNCYHYWEWCCIAPKSCTLVDSDSKMHKNDILPDHEI